MAEFLAFRLYGPFLSWGDVAVGEFRPSLASPTKSAVLGLVAAALGLRREDHAHQRALREKFGFAVRVDDSGTLLSDYHTIETPYAKVVDQRARTGDVPATRRDELKAGASTVETKTNLSRREYRMDALVAVVLWSIDAQPASWTLQEVAEALRAPRFVPYLGRKSCALALPLSPTIVLATHPVCALRSVAFPVDVLLGARRDAPVRVEYRWETAGLPTRSDDPQAERIERRRDQPGDRTAWLFEDRDEHVLIEGAPWRAKEADDVLEQD